MRPVTPTFMILLFLAFSQAAQAGRVCGSLTERRAEVVATEVIKRLKSDSFPSHQTAAREASYIKKIGKDIAAGGQSSLGVYTATTEAGEKVVIKLVMSAKDLDRSCYLQTILAELGLAVKFKAIINPKSMQELGDQFDMRPVKKYRDVSGLVYESMEGGWAPKEQSPPKFAKKLDIPTIVARLERMAKVLESFKLSAFSDFQVMIMPDSTVKLIDIEAYTLANPAIEAKYGHTITSQFQTIIETVKAAGP